MEPTAQHWLIGQVQRMKEVATLSHVAAQRDKLLALLEATTSPSHCVVTRLSDDTNVWIQGSRNQKQDKVAGRSGGKKVSAALGLCERLSLRSAAGLVTVRLHSPAQILPKAGGGRERELTMPPFKFIRSRS